MLTGQAANRIVMKSRPILAAQSLGAQYPPSLRNKLHFADSSWEPVRITVRLCGGAKI